MCAKAKERSAKVLKVVEAFIFKWMESSVFL